MSSKSLKDIHPDILLVLFNDELSADHKMCRIRISSIIGVFSIGTKVVHRLSMIFVSYTFSDLICNFFMMGDDQELTANLHWSSDVSVQLI